MIRKSNVMHKKLLLSLLAITLARAACAADGGVDACNALPAKFEEIRANLALHTKVMTPEQIEKAVTQGPISIGRGFNYNFAFLLDYLGNEVNDWVVRAKNCGNVNQPALSRMDDVCGKQVTDFLLEWKRQKVDRATSELDSGRKIAVGKTLAARVNAICFVGAETQLFAPR